MFFSTCAEDAWNVCKAVRLPAPAVSSLPASSVLAGFLARPANEKGDEGDLNGDGEIAFPPSTRQSDEPS
jgi:hypothetical protein